jgi:hypothetical protein
MFNWQALLIDALAGAVAGGLAWLVASRAKNPKGQGATMVRIACIVAAVVAAQQRAGPMMKGRRMRRELHAAGIEMYGNEESAALNTQLLGSIISDPRFEKRIYAIQSRDTSAPAKGAAGGGVAGLVAAGMARLDAADQAAIFDVKVALADKSPALCAGFWTGNVPLALLSEAMRALDRTQQRTWITVSGRALTRELEASAAPPSRSTAAGTDAMAELIQRLSPEQRAALAAADQGAPSEQVACGAFRALAAGLRKVSDEKRAAILRLLSAAASGGR